jgi:hypothetical protein
MSGKQLVTPDFKAKPDDTRADQWRGLGRE